MSMYTWDNVEAMDPSQVLDMLQGDATLAALFDWRVRGFWFGEGDASGDETSALSDKPSSDPNLLSAILRSLDMGLAEAHMVMMLLLCPKIKELNIWNPPQYKVSLVVRLLELTLSKEYRTATPPDPVYDFEQDESDFALAQMFGAPWRRPELQKSAMLETLEKCALHGTGPFSFSFFRKFLDLPALQDLFISSLHGGYGASLGDLKVDVPCTQLKKLTLVDCRLRTCEISSIIQCCPNLLDLSIHWDSYMVENIDVIHNDPSMQDYPLSFGQVGDAIVSYAPMLKSLNMAAHQWPYRHSVSEYPNTMGKALQRLEHLEDLSLDHCVIYGDEEGSVSHCTLSETVPKSVSKLNIGPNKLQFASGGGEEPIDSWQDWQIDDLNHFWQDSSFERLRVVELTLGADGNRGHFDRATISRHGWENTEDDGWSYTFEKKRRPDCRRQPHVPDH